MAKEPLNAGVTDADEHEAPTPTQAENDRAKLGGRAPEAEPKAEIPAKAGREAKPAAGAAYETR